MDLDEILDDALHELQTPAKNDASHLEALKKQMDDMQFDGNVDEMFADLDDEKIDEISDQLLESFVSSDLLSEPLKELRKELSDDKKLILDDALDALQRNEKGRVLELLQELDVEESQCAQM